MYKKIKIWFFFKFKITSPVSSSSYTMYKVLQIIFLQSEWRKTVMLNTLETTPIHTTSIVPHNSGYISLKYS